MLTRRRSVASAQRTAWNTQIAAAFLSWPIYRQCASVMFYVAMPDEAGTDELLADALRAGKRVYVPLLGEKYGDMSAIRITKTEDLVVGKFGLKMPKPDVNRLDQPISVDLIVVPGVAFDRSGNRLGMGAGYYDRFFARNQYGTLLGLAWGCQVVERVPGEDHDVRMHYLLTEEGLIVHCPN